MILFRTSFSILVIILSVLAVYTKDSVHSTERKTSENAEHLNSNQELSSIIKSETESKSKPKTLKELQTLTDPSNSEPRSGANGESLFKEFWHSLYVDRTFNSSFALNVPLFTLTVPGYGRKLKDQTPLSALNVGNLAILGIVVLGSVALAAPFIFPEFKKRSLDGEGIQSIPQFLANRLLRISESVMGRSLNAEERQGVSNFLTSRLVGVSESIMGYVEKTVDDFPSFPRLDAQECMKRSICEAHNQPKKYGLMGLVLQLFFPPYTEAEEPLKVVSKYQLAARYGRQDNANCATQYDGCMINFLDVVQGLINLIF